MAGGAILGVSGYTYPCGVEGFPMGVCSDEVAGVTGVAGIRTRSGDVVAVIDVAATAVPFDVWAAVGFADTVRCTVAAGITPAATFDDDDEDAMADDGRPKLPDELVITTPCADV